jgi:hypothetical protein
MAVGGEGGVGGWESPVGVFGQGVGEHFLDGTIARRLDGEGDEGFVDGVVPNHVRIIRCEWLVGGVSCCRSGQG